MILYLGSFGVPYGDELLSDHRQNFDVDSVEFIKAAPGAWLSETTEETAHHLEDTGERYDTISDTTEIKHHALNNVLG